MNTKLAFTVGLGGLALSGCASTYSVASGEIDPADFGEANRMTYAAMIVNPDPVYTEPLTTSADTAAAAVERYRDREVEEVQAEDTTSIGGGGGGGG